MRVSHLELSNVRSFRRLDLDLSPGIHVIVGSNASGKTNLLEAIAMLATTRGARGGGDGELISWDAVREDPLPAARLAARVEAAGGHTTIEITVIARAGGLAADGDAPAASRRFRVNGVARRASDLIGRLRVVMFSADDIAIIDGPPAGRRRFLDITLSQLDGRYVRALQRYGRVLQQRNSLLRQFQGRRHDPGELEFWDGELAAAGTVILGARTRLLCELGIEATARHAELAAGAAPLEIVFRPAVPEGLDTAQPEEALEGALREALEGGRAQDVRRGATQIGPHRDDVAFLLGGHDAGAYASRGEQRTVALALRLAEVTLSTSRTGDPPLLLLDDILSELDEERRARVIHAAYDVDQVLITTPDADRPTTEELPGAYRYVLRDGALESLEGSP
jgi:DNA replication and repair protein RecF